MQTVTIDGRRITYQHVGQGPPVILAHCSSGFHRMWSTAIAELSTRYRVLAPDLLGYGKSERWRPGDLLEPDDDTNVIRGLAFLVGGPVHLVGHSFGGSVVLEAARTLGDQVRSLTLIEPVTFHLLRLARREAEWAEISEVSREMQAAAAKGHLEQAAGIYMSFWIGRLRWWLTPTRAKRAILDTLAKTVAEFGMIERMATSLTDYTRIEAPARLIVGEKTTAPARAVSEVLHAVLPEAHGLTLLGVGHMSPITHAAQVAGLVTAHLDAVTRGASTGKALNVA